MPERPHVLAVNRRGPRGEPAAGYPWPVRLGLGALLVLNAGLSSGAVYCGLWLVVALPQAPCLPLLGLLGLSLVLNALALRCYWEQQGHVAAGVLAVSAVTTWLVLHAVLLCAFVLGFLF